MPTSDPDPAVAAEQAGWARELNAALEPWARGAYLNTLEEAPDRVRAGVGEDSWRRLVAVKRAWDPDNRFRLNPNIDPQG